MAVPLLTKKIVKKRVKQFKRPQSDRKISVKVLFVSENSDSLFCFMFFVKSFWFFFFYSKVWKFDGFFGSFSRFGFLGSFYLFCFLGYFQFCFLKTGFLVKMMIVYCRPSLTCIIKMQGGDWHVIWFQQPKFSQFGFTMSVIARFLFCVFFVVFLLNQVIWACMFYKV